MYLVLGTYFTLLQVSFGATAILTSTEFRSVAASSAFVDKTMLIRNVLESKHHMLITTPPKFGKSTNIDMIKTFLEIEVNEFGDPKTEVNITTSLVNDTENYLYFVENKLKITEHPDLMFHLGKTPVVSVDFKRKLPLNGIRCLYDAIKICKEVVHRSYKAHEYLLYSYELSLEDKQIIRTWCDDHSFKTKVDDLFMAQGLPSLIRFLYKHFRGRKVFVLVDNHDFLVTRATYDMDKPSELGAIVGFVYSMIGELLNGDGDVVSGVLVTGVSQISKKSGFNLTGLLVHTYTFWEHHEFSEYFGLTRNDVDLVVHQSENYLDPKEIELMHSYSNGYHSKGGLGLYNIYSVLMFLKLRRAGRVCTKDDYPPQVLDVIKKPRVKILLNGLLKDDYIKIKPFNKTSTSDIEIKNCFCGSRNETEDLDILFYLLNWGLLTYKDQQIKNNKGFDFLKIPNRDVKEFLLELYSL